MTTFHSIRIINPLLQKCAFFFETAHDFIDLSVFSSLTNDSDSERSAEPPRIPDGPLPDISAVLQPPNPLVVLKSELNLIFLE
jgi:hypothetical protein